MLLVKWILVGAFIGINPTPQTPKVQVSANVFDTEDACKKDVKDNAIPYFDEAVKDGRLTGYILACKKIEVTAPVVKK